MLRILQMLFFGHVHTWEQIERQPVYVPDLKLPTHIDFICRCKTCGHIRSFRT